MACGGMCESHTVNDVKLDPGLHTLSNLIWRILGGGEACCRGVGVLSSVFCLFSFSLFNFLFISTGVRSHLACHKLCDIVSNERSTVLHHFPNNVSQSAVTKLPPRRCSNRKQLQSVVVRSSFNPRTERSKATDGQAQSDEKTACKLCHC